MKIQELLLPLTLALLTTWGLQYFWTDRQSGNHFSTVITTSGQKFEAPTSTQIPLHKPLNLEIDFLDASPIRPMQHTIVEAQNARYVFSNNGACLHQISFFRNWGGKEGYLDTLPEIKEENRELCSFLVVLDQKTPFYFNLIQETHDDRKHILKYSANFEHGVMYKTFIVFHDIHRIDLEVTIEPKKGYEILPRLFYASPYLNEESAEDIITAINNDEQGVIQQHGLLDVAGHYWSKPTMFGTMDRYFVFALLENTKYFIQRGYYKLVGQHQLYSVLEGSSIKEPTTWHMSFYVGPKTSKDMVVVDERLDAVMKYGFLGFISKPISRIMIDILNFLYSYCNNYGIAIILITILLKLIMLPFTLHSEQAITKSRQQRVQFEKKLKHLQTQYKDDPQGLAQARAELIKKHGMPSMGGCLPLLVQLPIFWGLSVVLSQSIELYKAPFLWIPDLSLPDPYYILPILTGIGVMLHNPTMDSQQRLTSLVMGIFLMAFTANFSSGLTLYICVSTLLAAVQTYIVNAWKK